MNADSPIKVAKLGEFTELEALWNRGQRFDLGVVFERAVTDFRTVKRKPGHQDILRFCIDQGLEIRAETVSLAARFGNMVIVDYMERIGLPDDPFIAASMGDLDRMKKRATKLDLADLRDSSGFNLLHVTAGSGLGRFDPKRRDLLDGVCEFLIESGRRRD
jgi:hypothetical protein